MAQDCDPIDQSTCVVPKNKFPFDFLMHSIVLLSSPNQSTNQDMSIHRRESLVSLIHCVVIFRYHVIWHNGTRTTQRSHLWSTSTVKRLHPPPSIVTINT